MLATLLLSFGTPMLVAGDEFAHTQMGNNNPYCQDNAITWVTWEGIGKRGKNLAKFTRRLIKLRRRLSIFLRRKFFKGEPVDGSKIKDLTWYTEKGEEFAVADWQMPDRKYLAYSIYDGTSYIFCILNAGPSEIEWKLPNLDNKLSWELLLDSSDKFNARTEIKSKKVITVPAWSVLLFEIKK